MTFPLMISNRNVLASFRVISGPRLASPGRNVGVKPFALDTVFMAIPKKLGRSVLHIDVEHVIRIEGVVDSAVHALQTNLLDGPVPPEAILLVVALEALT